MVVAQLVERSLLTLEICGSNLDIGKTLSTNCTIKKTKIKKKRPGMAHLKKKMLVFWWQPSDGACRPKGPGLTMAGIGVPCCVVKFRWNKISIILGRISANQFKIEGLIELAALNCESQPVVGRCYSALLAKAGMQKQVAPSWGPRI